MDFIRHDKFISWVAACSMAVAACFLHACKQPSDSDLTQVTGGSQTPAVATTTTTTVPTPVVVNGPIGNSALAFTPQSFAFGTLVQNSGSATKTFIVTNTSTYTLVLGAITGTDANFTVTANICLPGFSMAPSVSCTFTIQFAPTVSGNLSAAITIPYAVSASQNIFTSLLSVTGAGTSLVGFAGLATIDNQTPATMRLNWTDVAGASTYQIYNMDSGTPVLLASVISANLVSGIGCGVGSPAGAGQCSYTATGLLPSTSHTYRVAASDFLGVQSTNTHDVTSQTTADFLDVNGAASASAGACTALTVALTQADHSTAETVAANTAIAISGLASGAIYSDNTCSALIASPVVIASGNSSATFYFKDNVAESLTLSATRSQFSSTTKAFTVNPSATITSVAFVAAPGAAYTASNSAPMTTVTVAIKDTFGNVIATNSTATVTLSLATGSSALGGTLTKTVFHGVATFSDITYAKSETITIKATENTSGSGYNVTSSSVTVNPAATASVAWLTPPVATRTASSTPMPTFTAELKDSLGNVVTSDNLSTITLTRTGTGTLGGTLTKTVSNGVATFDDIIYTKAESVTFTATESSANHYFVTKDTAVSPAAFSLSQSLLSSAASVNSGSSITVTLTTKDAFGNSNPSGITTVSFTSSHVGGTGTYSSVTNAGAGVYTAAFTGVIAGSVTLGATINGGTVTSAPAPATITVNPSPTIASVAFVAAPPATYTASTTAPMTAFTAAIKDANGNVITSNSTAHITVLGVGSATLGGTLTKTVSSGAATFDDITYTKAETIQITATEDASGSNLNVTSGSITVNPSPVIASVAFVAAPPATYTASNTTPMTAFTAAIKDSFGNIITTNSTSQLHLGLSLGSGSLSATVYVSVSNGIATFSDVTYTKPETIRLTVDLGSLSVTSSDITVTARLAFTTQPSSSGDTDTALPQQPVIAVQDGNGATASGATNAITLTAYSDSACTVPVASALVATTNPLSATSGVAAFSGIKILKTSVVRIGASATGITSACSSAIATAAGAVNLAQSSVTWFPASLIANNSATSAITVTLKDANGNGIPGKTVTATSDRGADTISGSGGSTTSSGVVNLTVKSSSTGSSAITVVGNGTAMNPTVQVQFLAATPLTDYQSRLFNAISPGDNSSSVKSVWKDLARSATTYDGSLFNFLFNTTSGWSSPSTYKDEVLSDSPVGYWRLGETSGTTAHDYSGNGNDGSYTGGYTLAQTGISSRDSDGAVQLDGSSGYVTCGTTNLRTTLPVTLEAWAYPNVGEDGTYGYFVQSTALNNGDMFAMARDASTNRVYYVNGNAGRFGPVIPTAQWSHLVMVFNASAPYVQFYLNGVEATIQQPASAVQPSGVLCSIGRYSAPDHYLNGKIDEVAIYNTALSADRILAHYNRGVHPDPSSLVFDGGTSNSYVDFGTGVNGNTNFSFETWIKPASAAATGKVILSNGTTTNSGASNETNTGLTLRQSKTYAGKLELYLGESGEKAYAQEVLSDAPVGYWHLDETTTGTAPGGKDFKDESGNGNHGTKNGSLTLGNDGVLAKAVNTNAGAGTITVPNSSSLNPTHITIETWVNLDAVPLVGFQIALNKDEEYRLFGSGDTTHASVVYKTSNAGWGSSLSGNTVLQAATWYHVAATYDGAYWKLYLNGQPDGTKAETGDLSTSTIYNPNLQIVGYGPNSYTIQGAMDEVAIYNQALSPARILAHYNAALSANAYATGLKRTFCTSTSTFANNVWRSISGVFDSTGPTLKLFVDGTQECSITNAGAAYTGSTNSLRAGRDSSAGNSWAGQMADLRTYGSALANSNVKTNAVATWGRFPNFPRTDSALVLWLAADSGVTTDTTAGSTTVSSWQNQSGTGSNAVQSTKGNQPLYVENGLNGKAVLRFDGSRRLTHTFDPGSSGMTAFIVSTTASSSGDHALFASGGGGATSGIRWALGLLATSGSDGYGWAGPDSATRFGDPSGLVSTNTGYLMTYKTNKSNWTFYKNGSQINTVADTTFPTGTWNGVIGAESSGGAYPFIGDLAEVLIYTQTLSDADRQAVEAYLNAKYGLY